MANVMDPLQESGVCDELSAKQNTIQSARDFFQRVLKDGKLHSECLIKGCHRMLSGVQKSNLERHLSQIHNIQLVQTLPNAKKVCRLCFTQKSRVIGVFSAAMDIVNMIRTHFTSDEVSENDLLPKYVCCHCWNQLSKFHDFYVAVNEARIIYLASTVKIEDATVSEVNIDSLGIAANILDDESMFKMEYSDGTEEALHNTDHSHDTFGKDDDKCANIVYNEDAEKLQGIQMEPEQVDVQIAPNYGNFVGTIEQKVHKYFKSVRKNSNFYSECLIQNCHRMIPGNEVIFLVEHLRMAHHIDCALPVVYTQESPATLSKMANLQEKVNSRNEPIVTSCQRCTRKQRTGCRKHFQSVTKNGKLYSKCLVENCGRILAGEQKFNLERHLKVRHQMSPPFVHQKASKTASSTRHGNKFFKDVKIGRKLFSKCLVENCHRLLIGKRKFNLERHLKVRHQLNQTVILQKTSETESDNRNADVGIQEENRSDENQFKDPPRVGNPSTGDSNGTFVKVVSRDGESYSKCVVDNCNRLFFGKNSKLLEIHLRVGHQIKQSFNMQSTFTPEPTILSQTSNVRKYFKCFSENGRFYSKCLASDCERMLSGNNKSNMERHMLKVHGINMDPSEVAIDDTSQEDPNRGNEPAPKDLYIYYDSNRVNGSFFEGINKDGRLQYKCTVKNCYRLLPADEHLLRSHLNVIHKIEDSSEEPNVRNYFERVTENGNMYWKCLVEKCGRMIAGDQKFNLRRHLRLVHKKF